MAEKEMYTIEVAKRPWYEWLLWGAWFLFELFILQNAIASGQELEPRAAILFWVIFALVFVGGALVWFLRRSD